MVGGVIETTRGATVPVSITGPSTFAYTLLVVAAAMLYWTREPYTLTRMRLEAGFYVNCRMQNPQQTFRS